MEHPWNARVPEAALSSPWRGGERARTLELSCFPAPFTEELGTGHGACSAIGSERRQQREGPAASKGHSSSLSSLPSLLMLMLREAWGSWYSSVPPLSSTRHSLPGHTQICTALVIIEVFVLKNNWKDTELPSLCPEWEGGGGLIPHRWWALSPGVVEGAQGSPCFSTLVFVFYFNLFIQEPTAPLLNEVLMESGGEKRNGAPWSRGL